MKKFSTILAYAFVLSLLIVSPVMAKGAAPVGPAPVVPHQPIKPIEPPVRPCPMTEGACSGPPRAPVEPTPVQPPVPVKPCPLDGNCSGPPRGIGDPVSSF